MFPSGVFYLDTLGAGASTADTTISTATSSTMLSVDLEDQKDRDEKDSRSCKELFREFVGRTQKRVKGSFLGLPRFRMFCKYGTANLLRPTPMLC